MRPAFDRRDSSSPSAGGRHADVQRGPRRRRHRQPPLHPVLSRRPHRRRGESLLCQPCKDLVKAFPKPFDFAFLSSCCLSESADRLLVPPHAASCVGRDLRTDQLLGISVDPAAAAKLTRFCPCLPPSDHLHLGLGDHRHHCVIKRHPRSDAAAAHAFPAESRVPRQCQR